jgi:predicted MFS family arabinose efflux permease
VLEDDELAREQFEDALVDGDVPFGRGTAQAALRHGNFRIIYFGTFASNIGTWMQNVVLGAYAYKLTHGSSLFVGLVFFAQLGPLLFLSTLGGLLADVVDRRRFLVGAQLAQLGFSLVLALIALADHPSHGLILAAVAAVGISNAVGAPGLNAILPTLVPREDLAGAVSLASVQMNLSRVIGPPIGALIYHSLSAAPVFAINALTYLFAVIGLLWAKYPRRTNAQVAERGFARLLSGARIARRDPLLSHILVTLFSFSFFSLTFVGLMPVIAERGLGLDSKSWQYGVLYACFGLGAALGAVSVGTVFARVSKTKLLRPAFIAFAAVLAVFALLRAASVAYPVAFLLGYAYFVAITSLSTLIQSHLVDEERGRVMALWIMGFGGTVPVGVLVGGWITHVTSITAVIMAGAVWALVLAAWSNAKSLESKGAPDV